MRYLIFLACLIYGNTLEGQSAGSALDSAGRKRVISETDSNIRARKAGLKSKGGSLFEKQRNSASDGINGFKNNFSKKTDSTARHGLKNQIGTTAQSELDKGKGRLNSSWDRAKEKLPKGKDLFRFSMSIRSENFATTAQNPMIRSEMVFSRLYVSPTFTVFGLPFTSNLFYTTESNNTYRNNYFSFRLDVNAMRQMAMEQIRKEMDEAKKTDRLRQVDIRKSMQETARYEQEIERLKKQVPDYDGWQQTLEEETRRQCSTYLEKEKMKMEEKIRSASAEEKIRLENEYNHKKDSITAEYRNRVNDSLSNKKSDANENIDTGKLNRIIRLQTRLDQLKSRRKELEQLRQMDSSGLSKKIGNVRDPNQIRELADGKMPDKGLLGKFLSVDRFGIGLVSPQYSEFTLYAAAIKGLDIGVIKKGYYYDLSIGRTTRQFMGPFSSVRPEFDRNMGIIRAGLGDRSKDHLSLEYMNAYDQKPGDSLSPMVSNGVLNLNGRITMLKHLTIEGDIAQSSYREKYTYSRNIQSYGNSSNYFDGNANRAYRIKALQNVGENMKLEGELRQVGAAFRTVGNPFIRRNFREAEMKFEQSIYKKKIKLQASYKEMRDNLLEINSSTNRLKGYGLKLSTAFEKYPNVTLSHSPYQQGNNHPDSLYRTNNQFSITTVTLTYRKRFKKLNWNGMANYTNSAMEIGGRGTVAYRMLSSTHTIQIGQRNSSILSYMKNITAPFVDSLNSNSVQIMHNYIAKKGLSLGMVSEYTRYMNSSLKAGLGLTMSMAIMKNLSLSTLIRYDRINGLWRLENEDVWTGRVVVNWRW